MKLIEVIKDIILEGSNDYKISGVRSKSIDKIYHGLNNHTDAVGLGSGKGFNEIKKEKEELKLKNKLEGIKKGRETYRKNLPKEKLIPHIINKINYNDFEEFKDWSNRLMKRRREIEKDGTTDNYLIRMILTDEGWFEEQKIIKDIIIKKVLELNGL